MRAFGKAGGTRKTVAGVIAAGLMISPPPAGAAPDAAALGRIDTVYVADPATPWFESWTQTHLKKRDWLYRPDIRIKAGADLVAAVAADPAGIALLTRAELSRLQAAGAPQITAAPAGLSICTALSVSDARPEENFGDFALRRELVEILATPDTLAIAEALIEVHGFKDRMAVKEVKPAFAVAEVAAGRAVVAALPVMPQARLDPPERAAGLRAIALSQAAGEALRSRGLEPGEYRDSMVQRLPFIRGVRTACDEIVMITAPGKAMAVDISSAPSSAWTNPLTGSDLERRVRQALDALKAMLGKPAEGKG
jgi:hypothetical protein